MAGTAAQMTRTKLEAQGRQNGLLTHQLGFTGVLVFALSGIGLCYLGMFSFSTLVGLFPGSSLVMTVLAMAGAAAFLTLTYSVIGAVVPAYGADYCLASRVINPPLAFASSLTSVVLFSLAGGSLVASLFSTVVPGFIKILSIVTFEKALSSQAAVVSEPYAVALSGTLITVVIFFLLLLPPKTTYRILLVGFVLSLLAWGITSAQLFQAAPGAFPAAWERYFGDGSFLQPMEQAQRLGMQVQNKPGTALFAGLLLGFILFAGLLTTTNITAEIKAPHKNLLRGNLAALVVWAGVIAGSALLLHRHVSIDWISAQSFLFLTDPTHVQITPSIPFYAALLAPNPGLSWLIGILWMFGTLFMAHSFLYASSRVILAWAGDRLMPEPVGFVHPGLKSPLMAVLLVCILAEIGVMEAALHPGQFRPFALLFLLSGGMIIPVAAVIMLPFRSPALFKSAPGWMQKRIFSIPVMTVLGCITFIYLIAMMTGFLVMRPFASVGPSLPVLILFLVVFIIGLVWFFWRRSLILSQGESLDHVFEDFPSP